MIKKVLELIKKNKTILKELILYGIIGVTCASIDTLCFYLFRKISVPLFLANFLGTNIGILCSFTLNTFLNFKVKDKIFNRLIKFFIVGYIGLGISTLILYVGVSLLNFNELITKLFAVIIVSFIQFCLNKLITFKK